MTKNQHPSSFQKLHRISLH